VRIAPAGFYAHGTPCWVETREAGGTVMMDRFDVSTPAG